MGIDIEAMLFLFGAFLLLTAILGGGFEVRELRIPTISVIVRVLSGASGLAFVVAGIALSPLFGPVAPPPQDDPTASAQGDTPSAVGVPADQNCSGDFAHCYAGVVPDQAEDYSYVSVTDATGQLHVDVPSQWTDVNGAPYEDENGNTIVDVRASSDLDSFHSTWSTPGVIVSASTDVTDAGIETFVNRRLNLAQECELIGDQQYDDGLYSGIYDLYWGCGGTEAMYAVITAMSDDQTFIIGAEMLIVDERDLQALDQMIASFVLTGGGSALDA